MSKEAVIDALESMTVVELNQLVKELEDRWGVSAAAVAPVAVAAGGGAAVAEEGSAAAEKTSFDVHLKEIGDNKLEVIKRVKDILGIGIKEAKAVVDEVPKALKTGVGKDEAEEIKNKLVDAGAVVEIK